jgi:hypothetical protein
MYLKKAAMSYHVMSLEAGTIHETELIHADGQTDTIKLIVVFRNAAKAPKNYIMCLQSAGQLRFIQVEKVWI